MPALNQQPSFSRVEASDLIKGSYVLPSISSLTAHFIFTTAGLAPILTFGLIFAFESSWALLLVFAIFGLTVFYLVSKLDGRWLASCIQDVVISRFRKPRSLMEGPRGEPSRAGRVSAATWIYRDRDYEDLRKVHRAANGRQAPDPYFQYRFVVATYLQDGLYREVAFSDGNSFSWQVKSNVFESVFHESWHLRTVLRDGDIASISDTFERVIGLLDTEDQAMKVVDIIEALGQDHGPRMNLALEAARRWRLITTESPGFSSRTSIVELEHHVVEISRAGRTWNQATKEYQDLREEHKRMSEARRRPGPINIGDHFTGVVNYAGKNISGQHSYTIQQANASDQQVLDCLRELLAAPRIPWGSPELTGVQWILEEAVSTGDLHVSGLDRAISRIKSLCGAVLEGVISNGAYQLLMHYFR